MASKRKSEAEKIQAKERERIHKEMLKSAEESRKDDKQCDPNVFVSLQHINKIYDNHVQAVYDFNLDIKENEFIVLVGPSGCGKSTTLRMVAGLEEITFGDLYIDGLYANDLAPKDRDIAMVFQSYALYPHMTVYNNIAFGLKIRKTKQPVYLPCPEADALINENKNIIAEIKELEKLQAKALADGGVEDANAFKKQINVKKELLENSNLKAKSLRKQVVDYDPEQVKRYKKEIVLIEKELVKTQAIINKNQDDKEKVARMLDKIAALEDLKQKDQERVEFYTNNQVPIFKFRKLTKAEIDVEVKKAAKILDLTEYLDRKPAALSGGQRQRVALGRAIVRNSKLFLMDEPLSNLDAKLRVQMRTEIVKLHKGLGKTTIYVTHDQTEAMTMATRIVVMSKGYVQQIGAPKEIYNKPNNIFVATFIGSPAMNIFPIRYNNGILEIGENYNLKLDDELIAKHDAFYQNKKAEYVEAIAKVQEELSLYDKYKEDPMSVKLNRTQQINFKNSYYAKVKEVELIDRQDKLAKFEQIITSKDHMIMFGVRPEDIFRTVDKTDSLRLSDSFKVKVVVPELLGREYYVHYMMGGHQYIAKISSGDDIAADDILNLAFNLDAIHLFDEVTTELIDK